MNLIVLMGIPASGKTTLARQLEEKFSNSVRLSIDELKGDWHNRAKEQRAMLLQQTMMALDQGKDVIVDDTMHLHSMRKPYWRLAFYRELSICWIHCECLLSVALWRDEQRSTTEQVGEQTIGRIRLMFQQLTATQRSFKVIVYSPADGLDVDHILDALKRSREFVVEKKREAADAVNSLHFRHVGSNNIVHQANLELNRLVYKIISTGVVDGKTQKSILATKRDLFKEIQKNPQKYSFDELAVIFEQRLALLFKV